MVKRDDFVMAMGALRSIAGAGCVEVECECEGEGGGEVFVKPNGKPIVVPMKESTPSQQDGTKRSITGACRG